MGITAISVTINRCKINNKTRTTDRRLLVYIVLFRGTAASDYTKSYTSRKANEYGTSGSTADLQDRQVKPPRLPQQSLLITPKRLTRRSFES